MNSEGIIYALAAVFLAAGVLAWLVRIPLVYNVRNLIVRWKTTLLTALAFTVVIALMTVMLAFVNGMQRLTENSGQPGNVIILSEGATDESYSNLIFSDVGDIENQEGISRHAGQPLCSRETYIIVNQPISEARAGRPQRRFLQLRGVDDPQIASQVHRMDLYPGGRWFSPAGVRELPAAALAPARSPAAIEVVLGEGIARELGLDRSDRELQAARDPERLDVGDWFVLGERPWLVVGVMRSAGSTFDSEVWAKRSVIGPQFGKETYTSLVLRTADEQTARRVRDFFNGRYSKAALQAMVETEYFRSLGETNRQFLYAVIFVAVVMGIGGVFGVMNTMFAAISQRSKDIGVLRVLGFARRQVLISFLLESLLIAVIGGALGCALGWLADGWTATSIVSAGPGGGKSVVVNLVVDAQIFATGMLLSVVIGLIGGVLPALAAMRLRPLESLR